MADLPDLGLFCAASDLSSADTDVERAMRELAAKIEIVRDLATKAHNPEQIMRQVLELRDATQLIKQQDFQKKLDLLLQEMAEAEGLPIDARQANGKYVIHTSKKPLSMYEPELWQKAFVHPADVFFLRANVHDAKLRLRQCLPRLLCCFC